MQFGDRYREVELALQNRGGVRKGKGKTGSGPMTPCTKAWRHQSVKQKLYVAYQRRSLWQNPWKDVGARGCLSLQESDHHGTH